MKELSGSIEAEQNILGCILRESSLFSEINKELSLESFYLDKNKRIYECFQELAEKGENIDLISVGESLKEEWSYLNDLVDNSVMGGALTTSIKLVKQQFQRRQVIEKLTLALKWIKKDGDGVEDIIGNVKEHLEALEGALIKQPEGFSLETLLNKKIEDPEEIIEDGILPKQGNLIIAGDSGVGKSLLTLDMAINISLGWPILGFKVSRARRVLIIQTENSEQTLQFRIKRLLQGKDITLENFRGKVNFFTPGKPLNIENTKNQAEIERIIKKDLIEVVILDPLISFHRGDENKNDVMRRVLDNFTNLSRKLDIAWIITHHFKKQDRDNSTEDRTRGASAIKDWTDTLLLFEVKAHENKILRTVKFAKVRNGPAYRPILLERNEDNFTHEVILEATLCPAWKVASILKEQGGKADKKYEFAKQLKDILEISLRTAQDGIKESVNQGYIKEMKVGRIVSLEVIE